LNASANGVAGGCSFSLTPVEELSEQFELVVANIDAPTLTRLAEALVARLAENGRLILTGYLDEQAIEVHQPYLQTGLCLACQGEADGWFVSLWDRSLGNEF
jgi:ribosomal protein L11 methylase PrmA